MLASIIQYERLRVSVTQFNAFEFYRNSIIRKNEVKNIYINFNYLNKWYIMLKYLIFAQTKVNNFYLQMNFMIYNSNLLYKKILNISRLS